METEWPSTHSTIEFAAAADFDAIADLNVSAFAEFAPHLEPGGWPKLQESLRKIAERARTSQFLVRRLEGRLVGSVAYCPASHADPAIFDSGMAAILVLAVDPNVRGHGIARDLTNACIELARRDGAAAIGLFTSELNLAARHLDRTLGFQQDRELPVRYGIRYFRFVLPLPPQKSSASVL